MLVNGSVYSYVAVECSRHCIWRLVDLEETVGLVRDGKEPVYVLVGQVTPLAVGRLFLVSS